MDVREMARMGGLARAEKLTAKERREIATKASKAGVAARKRAAKLRKETAALLQDTAKLVKSSAARQAKIRQLLQLAKGRKSSPA